MAVQIVKTLFKAIWLYKYFIRRLRSNYSKL